jgi:hypothetical protein
MRTAEEIAKRLGSTSIEDVYRASLKSGAVGADAFLESKPSRFHELWNLGDDVSPRAFLTVWASTIAVALLAYQHGEDADMSRGIARAFAQLYGLDEAQLSLPWPMQSLGRRTA